MSNHDMKPLDNELLNQAFFPPTLLSRKNDIENILINSSLGMYVIGGDRGVGKTTLMNSVRKKYDGNFNKYASDKKKFVFLHLNVINQETDLLRELVLFLEQLYKENFETFGLENDQCMPLKNRQDKKYGTKVELLKEKILFDIFLEEIEESTESDNNTKKTGMGINAKANITNILFSDINIRSENEYSTTQEVKNRKIKSPRQRKEDLIMEIVDLIDVFSDKLSIVIILDELDKMSSNGFRSFFEENKIIFTECSAIFFLLVDNKRFSDLRYCKKHFILRNLVRDFIFLPRLNWQEFLLVVPKILKIDDIEHLQKLYYMSKGNFREIIKIKKDYLDLYGLSKKIDRLDKLSNESNKPYYIIISFIDKGYIMSLPEDIKEFAIDFIIDVLEVYKINDRITEQELIEIEKVYLSENIVLNSVIRRVKSMIINFDVQSISEKKSNLKEELEKYYQRKKYFSTEDKYQPIELKTSEIGVLFRLMEIYYDSIDGVIVCEEENENTQFNVSYTANILISSNYMQPIIFTNEDGFAWNYEYTRRYDEMLEYLKEKKIKFIEIKLPVNETMSEHAANLIPFINKFKEKYE